MAHRKLQQEIDRVFKKVTEGLDIFDTLHERHELAEPNSSQKEKLENDLKREIKKLQKQREQIKVWQAGNEVKDKEKLLEHRHKIEVAMEQYKVIEKGSKIKAYSNTSLKASNELDPEEKEKVDAMNFIQETIDELESQYQTCESELEKIMSKKSKKAQERYEQKKEDLKKIQDKYRWHQQNLEIALRLLENDDLVPDDINFIKDDISEFLTNNRDANYVPNDYIYESLDLDALDTVKEEPAISLNGDEEKESSQDPESPKPVEKKAITERPKVKLLEQTTTPKKQLKRVLSTSSTATSSPIQPTNGLKPIPQPVVPVVQPEMNWGSIIPQEPQPKPSVTPAPVPEQLQEPPVVTPSTNVEPVIPHESKPEVLPPQPTEPQVVLPKVDDSSYLTDEALVKLPPGIQDVILSFYASRVQPSTTVSNSSSHLGSHRLITNVSNLLKSDRYFLTRAPTVNPSKDLSIEFQRCLTEWNKIRVYLPSEKLKNLDLSALFYGFYFSLSPMESNFVALELVSRGWKIEQGGWAINVEGKINRFDIASWSLV